MSLLTTHTEVLLGGSSRGAERRALAGGGVEAAAVSEVGRAIERLVHLLQADAPQHWDGEERYPYPYEIVLTPVSNEQRAMHEETIRVRGKHISHQGLEFVHHGLVPYRHMIASFRLPEAEWLGVLLELTWCRFVRRDTYENGGRFVRLALSPLEAAADGMSSTSPGKDRVQE